MEHRFNLSDVLGILSGSGFRYPFIGWEPQVVYRPIRNQITRYSVRVGCGGGGASQSMPPFIIYPCHKQTSLTAKKWRNETWRLELSVDLRCA